MARSSLESNAAVQGLSGLTWLLPVATLVFAAYLSFALIGGIRFDIPIWLVLLPSLPAMLFTWLALVVALIDASRRPRTQMSEEVRIVWLLALCLLNVIALLPYWLIVVRRYPPVTA